MFSVLSMLSRLGGGTSVTATFGMSQYVSVLSMVMTDKL